MIVRVSETDFIDAFTKISNPFTTLALTALFEHLTEISEDLEVVLELYVGALCFEYTEYADLEEFHGEYDAEKYPDLNTIRNLGTVLELSDGGLVIQNF